MLVVKCRQQVRQEFNREFLEELAASIKADGLLAPIMVREVEGKYEIIAGEQRWRASKLAGLKEVPVAIFNVDDQRAVELAYIENEKRRDLSGKEREDAITVMWKSGKYGAFAELARAVGKSREWISKLLSTAVDRKELGLDSGVSTGLIRDTKFLDPTSRKALIKATQDGEITKDHEAVGKIATAVSSAPEKARVRLVKAIAKESVPVAEVKEIATIALPVPRANTCGKCGRTLA